MSCVLCKIDEHDISDDDRRMAYFIVGQATEGDSPEEIGMCSLHCLTMIPALAAIGEVCGHDGPAKRIRAIGNIRLVPPPTEPTTGNEE